VTISSLKSPLTTTVSASIQFEEVKRDDAHAAHGSGDPQIFRDRQFAGCGSVIDEMQFHAR
jgi:hypothetical protein